MNKSIKIVIVALVIVIIVLGVIFYIAHNSQKNAENRIDINVNYQEIEGKELTRMVMVNGKLYYDTGKESNSLRCGMIDGKITSNIEDTKIPTVDNQANFSGEYDYQYGIENTIEICIDNKWYIFEAKEEINQEQPFFYGIVKETSQNDIIVEPYEGEEIRKSADRISINLGENNDVIYQEGTNVKVTYTGYIMETYPAKVQAVKIELKSAEQFEIRFYNKQRESNEKIHKILDKFETNQYDYDIYTYDGAVNILINGEELSLKNALLENKITMDEIIAKANQDLYDKKISGDMYKDGGSMIYQYDEFTIIKCHTLNGNRDVYIGTKEMTINDVM